MTNIDTNKVQLISEIYEVVLRPERYDKFMLLWERHISRAYEEIEPIFNSEIEIEKYINDPELVTHFQRAYDILEKIGREIKGFNGAEQYSNKNSETTFFINENRKIVHGNGSAKTLLGDIGSLEELSAFIDEKDLKKLKAMSLGLELPELDEQILVFHFGTKKDQQILFFARMMRFSSAQPAFLCIYAMGMEWDNGLELLLAETFALSASELLVGRGLCEGKSLAQISSERLRSLHTIRTQVKALLHKTGTNSQADLVRLIITLASFGRPQSLNTPNILERFEGERQIMIPMEGGREIPVHQFGAPDGNPAIFVHGMLEGISACKAVADLLGKNNIRLVSPVRPSFANSQPAYNLETAPEEFAADLCNILDYLEISSAPIIGHMSGSLYAFAAARFLPKRISAVLNVSGVVPIKSLKQFASMSSRQRVVAWTARFAPSLLPTILRTGISQIDRGDENDFTDALYAKGSFDKDFIANREIRSAIHAGYQFTIAQGHRAFEVDSRHVTRDWSGYVDKIQQKTIVAHGAFDQSITIDSVQAFAARHDNIELIEHDDAGQLLFYQKPKEIISTLSELLER